MSVHIHPSTPVAELARALRQHGYLVVPDLQGGGLIVERAHALQFATLAELLADAKEQLRRLRADAAALSVTCRQADPEQHTNANIVPSHRLRRLNRRSRPQPPEISA